jgi:hypothetical protein
MYPGCYVPDVPSIIIWNSAAVGCLLKALVGDTPKQNAKNTAPKIQLHLLKSTSVLLGNALWPYR